MMIHAPTRPDTSPHSLALALVLAIGLTLGFVAGQLAPNVTDGFGGVAVGGAAPAARAPVLTEADDWFTRHLPAGPVLTVADDWFARHR